MRYVRDNWDRIVIKTRKDRNVPIRQTLIVGKSGYGKSLCTERGIYDYSENGFITICITDVKNLLELAFMGFPPKIMADYHKRKLDEQDLEPRKMDIKIFHPFSFSIPKKKIPNFKFFTLPITSLGDSEFRFLIETEEDKTTRELLISALNSLNKNDSLWDFLLKVESMIERKIKIEGSYETRLPDKDNFCLSGISTGSLKNIDEIARIFKRFQQHMFLMPESFDMNLNIEEDLFKNQKEVKIFTTKYIKDQKTKDFVTLMLINQIVEKAENCKYPLLIVLDEIKDLVPSGYSRTGYKAILGREIAHHLNTTFRANNIASISSSQSFAGISKNLTKSNVFTETFIGSIDGETDLQNLKQIYLYDKEVIDTIQQLDYNEFIVRGIPEIIVEAQYEPFKSLFAPFPHREPYMKFDSLYTKYYPEKIVSYSSLINGMESLKKGYIKKGMEIKLAKIKEKKEEKEKLKKEKEELEKLKESVKKLKEEKKESREDIIKKRNEEIWSLRDQFSQNKLAEKFGISQPTINEILKRMKKQKEGEENS